MTYVISKLFEFSASHQLPGLPADHPCSRLHGHNYVVRVELAGPLDPRGFVFDYRDLGPFKAWLDAEVDHRHLNDLVEFRAPAGVPPTAEHMSRWLTRAVTGVVALPRSVLVQVWVSETPKTWATWTPAGGWPM